MIKEIYDLTKEERDVHEAIYGKYNDVPPNWKEVKAAFVATDCLIRIYTHKMQEYRQIAPGQLKGEKYFFAVTLHHFHDGTGLAIHYDVQKKRIRYFTFARCEHTYKEISRPSGHRSGIHVNECTKCGYRDSYDTSD